MPQAAPQPALVAPAECGQTANTGLLMDGNQIRYCQRPQQSLMVRSNSLGILNNRQRRRHALVAAAGNNDNRQFTTVHTSIGTCGCGGRSLVGK